MSLEDRQAEMRERQYAKQHDEKTKQQCQAPNCKRFARKGQPFCSRCTVKGLQEKLRDTLPGMRIAETGGRGESAEQEQNKAGNAPASGAGLVAPPLGKERPPAIQRFYSRSDVSRITGVPLDMIMRLEKRHIVSPERKEINGKTHVLFTEEQLHIIADHKGIRMRRERQPFVPDASSVESASTLDEFTKKARGKGISAKKLEKSVAKKLGNLGRGGGLV